MIQSITDYIKLHKRSYIIGITLSILSAIIMLIMNYIIQLFIDGIVDATLVASQIRTYLTIFLLTFLSQYLVQAAWVRVFLKESYKFQTNLRMNLFKKLMEFRKPFYQSFKSGDLMTRMTSDVDGFGDVLGFGMLILVGDGIWLCMMLFYLFFIISFELTIVSFIPIACFGVAIFFVGKEVDKRYNASRDSVAELSNEVLEVVEGVRVMRAYGKKHLEQARFQERTQDVVDKANHLAKINALYGPVARFFSGLSVAISLMYGSYQVDQGNISLGQLVTFQIYLAMLLYTIWGISDVFAIYQTGKVSYRKIEEILESDQHFETNGHQAIDSIDSISFNNYSFNFPDEDQATIENINLHIQKGQTLGIVGRTGSGKTTIVSQLLRQFPVGSQGSITINGEAIEDFELDQYERMIGYVPQDHILFSRSVRDNILFGNERAQEADLMTAIESANFTKDIDNMSEGLETLIGEKGVAISGGQKQRVAIARAMIREPELLILDDSLSAVDAKTETAIIENIKQIRKDKTNIIVTHRLSAVAQADWVVVLERGKIIEEGTPTDLLALDGWFSEQYHRQQMEA